MKIDLLFATLYRGGMARVISTMLPYLSAHEIHVRIIVVASELDISYYKSLFNGFDDVYILSDRLQVESLDILADIYVQFINNSDYDPDLIIATGNPYICYVARKALTLTNKPIPIIAWLHMTMQSYIENGLGGYEHLAEADTIIALTEAERKNILAQLPDAKAYQIPNPLNIDPEITLSTSSPQSIKCEMLYVGRISPEKHVEVIIMSLVFAKNWKLTIIGKDIDEYEQALKDFAQRNNVQDRVRWLGWRDNPWDNLDIRPDVFVSASHYESFGLSTAEALASGIPVISTPTTGFLEMLDLGNNGYLFDFDNYENLAAILNVIERGELRLPSPQECRQSIRKYSANDVCDRFVGVLNECLMN